ncbi:MAG: FMN-binding protein [Clostridiales bacterium]|nr:FMN-binding protein [Clostridiales bacterium]
MKKQLPGWAVLLIITLVAGLALGGTYALTKGPIAQQTLAQAESARKAALPDADTFQQLTLEEGAPVDWAYAGLKTAEDGSTVTVGHVSQITVKGYKGPVEVTVGLDNDLTLTGISVGGSDFAETAGLGAKAKEPAFQDQFVGKKTPVAVIKQGGTPGDNTVDAITAATITSNAVRDAVNSVARFVRQDVLGVAEIEMPPRPEDGLVFSAKERGFASPVYVEAAFDADGKITYIGIGDADFNETNGYGAAALEKENQYPFIGAQMPLEIGDVDALTGATFTKTAIVTGLNKAYDASKGVEAPAVEEPAAEIEMPARPEDGLVFSAKEQGFASPVYVEAAFDDEGKITYIGIGDADFNETPGFGAAALEKENQYPFIGAQMPLEIGDVDALTGATFTKTAIVTGLNKAYDASRGTAEEPAAQEPVTEEPIVEEPVAEEPIMEEPVTEEPLVEEPVAEAPGTEEPAAAAAEPAQTAEDADLGYTGQSIAFFTAVQADVSFEGNVISDLALCEKAVGSSEYAPMALQEVLKPQLLGRSAPVSADQLTGVPAYTAAAVALAVNEAYARSGAAEAPAEGSLYTGACVMFFDRYAVSALFDGDVLAAFELTESPLGGGEATLVESGPLHEALAGRKMPLKTADAAAAGLSSYAAQAIVIALNEAYAQSLAGQQ